ncbi:MAG TPA: hypothetical protein VF445_08790 [Bordetella sp.]|uniref:hypothetical protein n=1 Tax=Bordetella sp. TaxID=28081 RepID=UPI002ED65DE9
MNRNPVKGHPAAQDDETGDPVGKSSGRPPNRAQTGIGQRVGKLPFSYEGEPEKGRKTITVGKKP